MNITVNNVKKVFKPGKKALDEISFEIQSPCMIGLIGPNGAGKSTLMKILTAALLPDSGSITIDGEDLYKREQYLKRILGYLPQSFGLYDELTIRQFLDYMSALKGIRNSKESIDKVLEETNLKEIKNTKIKSLSGGQRQRTGIAQALLGNPRFIILDEPTVGLDPEERVKFRNLFSENAQDKIVLLSTHIIEDVQSICERLLVMNEGKILFDGKPEELIKTAQGHVGTFIQNKEMPAGGNFRIVSRINTASGIACRIVAGKLPVYAEPAEPTLEDAYLFLVEKGS